MSEISLNDRLLDAANEFALFGMNGAHALCMEALDEIDRLIGVVKRLGSMEAFDVSRSIDHARDRELLARIEYAQENLQAKP